MTLTLELKPETEEAVRERFGDNGFRLNLYVESLIHRDIDRTKLLDERLKPVRDQFEKSGMTEDELDEFMNGVLKKVRAERREKRT